VDDFESVAAGTKSASAPSPYAEELNRNKYGSQCANFYESAAFDNLTGKLYVTEGFVSVGASHETVVHVYRISGEPTTDTTSPVRSNGSPSGSLPAGTTQTTMSLTTNENATCKFATNSGITYSSMTGNFSTTGGTNHSTTITGLQNGQSYNRYVRCIDSSGNANTDDFVINFSVSQPSVNRVVNVSTLSQLYAAFSNQQQGDEIVIAPGTYTLNTTALPINVSNLVVRGSTGNRNEVVIRGDAMSAGASIKSIFYFPQGNYGHNTTIKDMTIGRVGWHVIFFNGAGSGNGTIVDNVKIYDSYEQMIKATVVSGVSTSNVTVKNSLFEYTAGVGPQYYIGGIDAHHADGWLIQGNEFRNIKSPSGSVAEHGVHLWSNSSFSGSNTIERNKIVNCDRGIGIWKGTGNNVIRNNMITHDGSGIFPDVGIDIQDTPNTKVYNNTVWIDPNKGYYAAIEFRGALTAGTLAVNNLANKQIAVFNGATGTFQKNVINSQSSWFINVANDLHLAFSVPSVVGQGMSVEGLIDDFDGQARTGGIDIGADQYIANIPGDINKDGIVNIFDYNIFLQHFGVTEDCQSSADLNGDCAVNIFDYNILLQNFGRSS
jgi:parallel beta-helix repeat protein